MAIVNVTDQNFSEEIASGVVLVDFWATWCGPCKMIAPVLEEIDAEIGNEVKIAKLDVDNNQATAAEYQVMSIPTLLLFKDGELKGKTVGFQPKEALIDFINTNK
ncbi:thioredoxin [Ureibacillus composti]|uniref:Thioredoxin n=1 Tax=Lysinibacillus composti TaxID=720633 RepID=A0A3N9UKM2_9BACI|nr:thioredoxin [Lysinibacillus composti]MBM7606908.1 thioredoxin 1 [Lysinibacillus composti]MDM5334698.1 thioredoxin [Ureibacillus composti]RQW76487.1 thioredoxin [Lysinibacillus composti]